MRQIACLTLAVALSTGCASIPNPISTSKPNFDTVPEAALREIATQIEMAVAAGNRDAIIEDRGGISVSSQAIKQAIRTRSVRAPLVREFLNTGHAWERRNGRIYIIRSDEYKNLGTRKDRDRNAVLVNGENDNRWTIYEGILRDNKLPSKALATIERIFFDARVTTLEAGQKFEDESGDATFVSSSP